MKTAIQAGARGAYKKHVGHATTIGRVRRAKGLTQAEAAKLARVSLRTWQRAETGDVVPRDVKLAVERSLGVAW